LGFAAGQSKRQDVVKNDDPDSESSLLMREILKHLMHHPDAKDSVEGIHNFWLSHRSRDLSREKVRAALDYLVDQKGWLTRKLTGTAVTLYGLDKNYLTEVRGYLRQRGDGG
jgi:hypothetical protein